MFGSIPEPGLLPFPAEVSAHVDAFASRPRPSPSRRFHPARTAHARDEGPDRAGVDPRAEARRHSPDRADGDRVRLWSRYGRNRTSDFATIAAALRSLPVSHAVLDGEAVAHCENGLPDFHRTLSAAGQREACLLGFDLLGGRGRGSAAVAIVLILSLVSLLLAGELQ